ncbi:MAG: amidophosphoribosyltransferase, partial [Chitinophagaceae bacterium]|nr:amidophosphoribosyltransferase [Chitinophagaceae bacterium]
NSSRPPETRTSDLAAMLDIIYHFINKAVEAEGNNINVAGVLRKCVHLFDGGFTFGGLIGNGSSFIVRDGNGIRPAYYYINDEVIVAASERAAIRTVFNVPENNEIHELPPGYALITSKDGSYYTEEVVTPGERRACSFERIYFSRGSDEEIYEERKALGHHLSRKVLEEIDHDLKNTIFSFIPNTAETAFYGLVKGAEDYLNQIKVQRIQSWKNDYDEEKLAELVNRRVRMEKIAIKDVKLRTFITEDSSRNEMVQHVYDITYGTVRKGVDTLVVIDDSIVRGTTLKESIIRMLSRLEPKKIIIVSSAPQIRYPDCYGIDMSRMKEFVAFRAARELLIAHGKESLLQELFEECKELKRNNQLHTRNVVKEVYKPFTAEEISDKIAQIVTPEDIHIPVKVIYQTIEDLHECCPKNLGDWYFTGDYPTPGGIRTVNTSFMNYMEGRDQRSY